MKARVLLCLAIAFGLDGLRPVAAADEPDASARRTDYVIIVTGEELLRGAYPDSHTHFLTRTLHRLGCHCVGSMTVDDRPADLKEALRFARGKTRLILVTGGLGPTMNDLTRAALAEFTGLALREDAEVLAGMEQRFAPPHEPLRPNLRRQALVPERGTYLPNPNGTAVGLVFETDDSVIVALPGPPRELRPMVTNELVPYLRRNFGVRPLGATLTLRFVGLGQSAIDQVLRNRVPLPAEVVVSSSFEGGRVDFLFALAGDSDADRAKLTAIKESVRTHLGDHLYAADDSSLEEVVSAKLRARGGLLTLVEVASSGDLGRSLSAVRGVDQLLAGGYEAPTEERMRRLLGVRDGDWSGWNPGEERVKGLAQAATKGTGSQWGLAVGGVEAGGSGAAWVWVAFGPAEGPWLSERIGLRESVEVGRANLTTQVLDWLWRRVR